MRLLPGARGRPDQVCLRGRPGHQVDYDELIVRNGVYRNQENAAKEAHACNLQKMADAAQKAQEGGRA